MGFIIYFSIYCIGTIQVIFYMLKYWNINRINDEKREIDSNITFWRYHTEDTIYFILCNISILTSPNNIYKNERYLIFWSKNKDPKRITNETTTLHGIFTSFGSIYSVPATL